MDLQLNLDTLELEGISGINESQLRAAVSDALQQRLANDPGLSRLAETQQPINLDRMDLQIDFSMPMQKIAEQIAIDIVQQLQNLG